MLSRLPVRFILEEGEHCMFIKKLEKAEAFTAVFLFVVIMAVLLLQIVMRKFAGFPLSWADELSRFLFVYLGIIGCHLAQKENLHVRIDMLLNAFGKRWTLAIEFFIDAVMVFFFLLIAFKGFSIVGAVGKDDRLVTLHLSVAFLNVALIFLGILMAIEMIFQMISIVKDKKAVRE